MIDKISELLFNNKISPSQTEGINTILSEWTTSGHQDKRWLAYILATAYHETGKKMQPVTEFGGEKYLKSKKYYPYYGRDLCQTTWLANYKKVKDFTGVDVVSNPELIKDLKTASKVIIEFMVKGHYTGKKLSDYFDVDTNDPVNARRIINGTDRAELIAGYYEKFLGSI
jgi:hypothetical protein